MKCDFLVFGVVFEGQVSWSISELRNEICCV